MTLGRERPYIRTHSGTRSPAGLLVSAKAMKEKYQILLRNPRNNIVQGRFSARRSCVETLRTPSLPLDAPSLGFPCYRALGGWPKGDVEVYCKSLRYLVARRRRAGGAGRTSPCRGVGQRPTPSNPPILQFPNQLILQFPLCSLGLPCVLCGKTHWQSRVRQHAKICINLLNLRFLLRSGSVRTPRSSGGRGRQTPWAFWATADGPALCRQSP